VKPETSHDIFLRDFGERFVPGYKAVSTVDLLMNAPFDEWPNRSGVIHQRSGSASTASSSISTTS